MKLFEYPLVETFITKRTVFRRSTQLYPYLLAGQGQGRPSFHAEVFKLDVFTERLDADKCMYVN